MSQFFIESYGCQMNMAESSALEALLIGSGWKRAEKPEDSDLVIINTCSVRQSAENRIWGRLGDYKHLKTEKDFTLILTGCMAERLKDSVKKEAPQIDYVVSVNDKLRILDIVGSGKNINSDKYEFTKTYYHVGDFDSYVPIMNGCNNFCSYCIVPYVRGREVSRDPNQVLDEVKFLDAKGVKEITLLGQNVNSYDFNGLKFPGLLKEICKACNSIQWIRFESPHPKDFSDELIEVIATEPRVAKHIHVPMQSGSTRILQLMNRRYSREQYLELINKIKKRIPDITFAVDVMVGFPGETEEEFQETISAMKEVGYIEAYMYYWNPREGTRACEMSGQMTEKEKQIRLQKLIDFQLAQAATIKTLRAKGVQKVLVTQVSRDNAKQMLGRNEHNEMVAFDTKSQVKIGDVVDVELLMLNGNTYVGKQV